MIVDLSVIILLIIISGFANAVMDTLQFHYSKSIFKKFKNQQWWNPAISWKNKYKNNDPNDGSKFFGSTTFLVFVTDAWHFFQFLFLTAIQFCILIGINISIPFEWWYWIVGYLLIKIIFGTAFELFYQKIFPE